MRTKQHTEQDFKNGYVRCIDCNDHAVLLNAGTEMNFVHCDQCGSNDVILVKDFEKY